MKLVLRADDVGYTDIANIGTFKAVDADVITNVDVMLDCPGTVDALKRLKERPWISLGWHSGHHWGKPVTDPHLVPSLVDDRGFFKWTVKNGTERPFGTDVTELKNSINYDEMVLELRNQIRRCIEIYGKAPLTTNIHFLKPNKVEDATIQVAEEYDIAWNWYTKGPGGPVRTESPCNPKYAHVNCYMPSQGNGTNKYMMLPKSDEPERYDPIEGFRNDGDRIMGRELVQLAFHPGYLDDYIVYDGGIDTTMTRIRVMDVHHLCRPELKEWIIDNKVELVNPHDAIYGTCEFQTHLKRIGSPMWMGNFR